MGLEEDFQAAMKVGYQLLDSLPNADKLALYALDQQIKVGDNNTKQPVMFDIKGRVMWAFWNSKKGMGKEQAMGEYIQLIEQLKEKHAAKSTRKSWAGRLSAIVKPSG